MLLCPKFNFFFSLGSVVKKKQWRMKKERIQTNGLLTAMMRTQRRRNNPKSNGRKSSLNLKANLRNAVVRGPDPDLVLVHVHVLKKIHKTQPALKTGVMPLLPPQRSQRKIPHRKMKRKLSLAKTYSGNGSTSLTLSSAKAPVLALTLSMPKPSAPSFAPPEQVQSFAERSLAERMQTPLA